MVAIFFSVSSRPPPNFYQLHRVYWGNPYTLVDSNNDSIVPLAVNVRATAIGVSTSVANVSAVVACASAASIDVSSAPVDLCPLDDAIADVSNAAVDVSTCFANMSADMDVTNINFVPVGPNHVTSLYENIMSASQQESTGQSVEPSNVTGIDNNHKMWIGQVMLDDWGI